MSAPRRLVVGLGNPGEEYALTRHNVGWITLDALTREEDLVWRPEKDLSHVATWGDVLLLKPGTYMNESGQAARRYLDYYKLTPAAVMVVHDDLDIPFGEVRRRGSGGSAGHHGLDSIFQHLGSAVGRIRIGIGRPPATGDGADYVLSRFSPAETEKLPEVISQAVTILREALDE